MGWLFTAGFTVTATALIVGTFNGVAALGAIAMGIAGVVLILRDGRA